MNLKCFIIITIIIPIVFLIIGTPLAAASFNNYAVADFFTSLPLITNQSIFKNMYFINTNLNSDLFLFNMKVQDKKIKRKGIYLIHNMFGYKIDANLIVNDIIIDTANISHNINLSETKPLKRRALFKHKLYKSAFKKIQISKNVFNVFCPISTEITRTKEIDIYCRNNYIPMIFDGYYSFVHIFSPIKSNPNGQIAIQFNSSYFYPYNFIKIPELYIIFIRYSSRNALLYSGIAMLVIGGILSVGLTVALLIVALNR